MVLVGRPNDLVKSSLLNQLARKNVPWSTLIWPALFTRDPVDESPKIDGEDWLFITPTMTPARWHAFKLRREYYSSAHAVRRHRQNWRWIKLILFDASQPVSDQI